ncbi:hypothetical protein ACFU9Y_08335 [Streptomyces sp. NPDC057621]
MAARTGCEAAEIIEVRQTLRVGLIGLEVGEQGQLVCDQRLGMPREGGGG